MVEADSHLKLLPTSILNIYTVFEHIHMLSIGMQQQPCTVIPILLGSDFEVLVLCHLFSQNDVTMSWLKLTATQTAPHIHIRHTMCLSTLICCPLTYSSSLTQTQLSSLLVSDFGVLCHLWSQYDVIMSWLRLAATSKCFPHPY